MSSTRRFCLTQSLPKQPHVCEAKHDILFLKVHKTGSSTVANILQRFGLANNLTFALPNKTTSHLRYNYFSGVGETLNSTAVKPSKRFSTRYNILYNHVIFNKSEFLTQFPKRDYTYVTMLREPTSQFTSSLLFFLHEDILKAARENISEYLKNPAVFEPTNPYLSFTDNRQSLDLGLTPTKLRDVQSILSHIVTVDGVFDLVLITEYFDESLVVLKRRMCWQLKDILYLRKNAAYQSFDFNLSEEDKTSLKKWNMADLYIYQYFREKFVEKLSKELNITEETNNFRRILNETRTFCTGKDRRSYLNIEQTPWNPTFRVTSLDCVYMRLGELQLHTRLLQESFV